jgi:hypothetical protein
VKVDVNRQIFGMYKMRMVIITAVVKLSMQENYSELELHLFPALQTCFLHRIILELHWVRVHSAPYLQVIIFQLRIVWEIVF